jgi:hypothetical protein
MITQYGNIWDEIDNCDAIVITTNGTVKANGACVMGRGIAREARDRYPGVDLTLGQLIQSKGNLVFKLDRPIWSGPLRPYVALRLVSFPVKHNWYEKACLTLIESSTVSLRLLADIEKWKMVIMPRPGCGNGNLKWEDVRPVIEPILDDRFVVMSFPDAGLQKALGLLQDHSYNPGRV